MGGYHPLVKIAPEKACGFRRLDQGIDLMFSLLSHSKQRLYLTRTLK